MNVLMVMFDTLNRHYLPPYGGDWVHAPNFSRLARRAATFDNAWVCSMPCIPARREIHTGRSNFLHCSWGPIEPFDDSMPEMLKESPNHSSHLLTDHENYLKDGGATYHTRYSTYEVFRGQMGDRWKADLIRRDSAYDGSSLNNQFWPDWWKEQDATNRRFMTEEGHHPMAQTFSAGKEFLERNHAADGWFLQLETFSPHEPFFCPRHYRDLYPYPFDYPGSVYDGLPTRAKPYVEAAPGEIEHLRYECAAITTMCDRYLGEVLDLMDRHDLWDNTLLIVNTDHGNMMGEHGGWFGKCVMPYYNEISRIPLFIWDPRSPQAAGQRRKALIQTIDLAPTILSALGLESTPDMLGVDLAQTVADDAPVREAGLFGQHSGHVNVTDGRYVYMRAPVRPDGQPLNFYTLMPTTVQSRYPTDWLKKAELSEPFSFTKGCRLLKFPNPSNYGTPHAFGTLLFDLETDPEQQCPIQDADIEKRMIGLLGALMKEHDAPDEQWERLGMDRWI